MQAPQAWSLCTASGTTWGELYRNKSLVPKGKAGTIAVTEFFAALSPLLWGHNPGKSITVGHN
jgi:hypothetical protein